MRSEPRRFAVALVVAALGVPTARAQTDAWQTTLPPAHVQRAEEAKSALRHGDAAAAERKYRELLAVEPDYYRAQYNLGLALLAQGRNEEAAAALERAVEIRARLGLDEPTIFNSLGWAHYLAGDLARAEAAYLEGVKLAPRNSRASNQKLFNNLGALYLRQGRLDDAEAVLVRARDEFGSVQAEANLEMVRSLRASERYVRASEQLVVKPAQKD